MEYVAGRTLRDLLREKGRLSPAPGPGGHRSRCSPRSAPPTTPGIVHRDVKPENVLLADDGRIKVADFGLARAVSGATSHTSATGVLMGTVAYLSPEQVERGVADPRSDVYAAGILLFEMLTGAKPYDGETRDPGRLPPRPRRRAGPVRRWCPACRPALDALVARATSRDPDGRPADARRFLAELSQMRRGLSDTELDTAGRATAARACAERAGPHVGGVDSSVPRRPPPVRPAAATPARCAAR